MRGAGLNLAHGSDTTSKPGSSGWHPPPATNEIQAYLHCAFCIGELDARARAMGWDSLADYIAAVRAGTATRDPSMAPMDYARLDVGWTPVGFQVWCRRHEANVLSVDFEGVRHPATTAAS